MKILPSNENSKATQKVVVGDKDGVLQSFTMKKKELTVSSPLFTFHFIHCYLSPESMVFKLC